VILSQKSVGVMVIKKFFKILLLFLFLQSKSAGLSISVTGASSSLQDATTATNLTIYAGHALPEQCKSKDNSSTCNSCTGLMITDTSSSVGSVTFPSPCNENSIYSSLVLSISVNSDKTDIGKLEVGASKTANYGDGIISVGTKPVVNGKSYSYSIDWGTLVSTLDSESSGGTGKFNITDCTSSCGGTRTFYFGPIKESAYVEKIAVTVNLSYVDYTPSDKKNVISRSFANICKPRTTGTFGSDVSSPGFCYFEMIPGDEKAYITNHINGWGSDAKDTDSTIKYSHLVMYHTEQDTSLSVIDNLKKISNASPRAMIKLTDKEADPLEEYKITDLENEKSYCFLPAMKDLTGNIQYFLDVQRYNSTSSELTTDQLKNFCAAPSEVIGVLGDKNCFIATATFGSALHPYLNILRQFRDQILLKYSFGKKFVKWYYKNGPQGAHWIEKNDFIKPFVKLLLIPLIGIAYALLNHFVILNIFILILLGMIIVFLKKQFIILNVTKKLSKYIFIFFVFSLFLFPIQLRAQGQDEFMEVPSSPTNLPTETPPDAPPNEPPYVKSEDQIQADLIETDKIKSAPIESPTTSSNPKDRFQIAHPNAAKGLYLIDQNTGKYYYKTDKNTKKNQTTSLRLGYIEPPQIESTTDASTFTFADMYGDSPVPYLILDYEWQPFASFRKMGFVLGMGLFTSSADGFYKNDEVQKVYGNAKESFTFIGLPISAGGLFRFEFAHRQWVVPFVNAGLSYFILGEIRDDGKKTHVVGTPGGYGGGGLMFNITAWDRDVSFTMDREYGINNMWLTAEYKYVKSFNEDLDISSSVINIGISVDY
jgi:hypothetical protein